MADALIGVAGAWASFFILARTLSLSTSSDQDVLTLVGLGIITGFGAKAILKQLSDRFQEVIKRATVEANKVAADTAERVATQVSTEQTKETATEIATEKGGVAEDYGDSKRIIDLIDLSEMQTDKTITGKLISKAEDEARAVLRDKPKSPQVLAALAVVPRHKADLLPAGSAGEQDKLMKEAIDYCSQAIALRPDLDWAYYNRACYRALNKGSVTQVEEDIKKAIELLAENQKLLSGDSDLDEYKRSYPEVAAALQ